jgi:dolichyl-phosphate beta-glucosyltransferase
MRTRLSLIIPTYNEEEIIGSTLKTAVQYLDKGVYSYEIIVVCDGCRDNTASLAQEAAKKNSNIKVINRRINRGKGFSVKEGVLSAHGSYIIFTDADLSTPIDEINKLIKMFEEGYAVVIGSRALVESDVQIHQPWYREGMGKIFNILVQALAVRGIKDTQCGFKGFRKDVAEKIFPLQTINGFGFDVELLYLAKKHSYTIKEIPVRWLNRAASKVNPLTHSSQMFLDLIRIRIRDIKGRYE